MAVVNSYFSPVQSPYHLQHEVSNNFPDDAASTSFSCFSTSGLSASKSQESLNTLLTHLPDIVIPEPLYNPLPLQCLAANALPEAVRRDIDQVLGEYSTMATVLSPRRLQESSIASQSSMLGGGLAVAETSVQQSKVEAESSNGREDAVGADETVVSAKEVSVGDMSK